MYFHFRTLQLTGVAALCLFAGRVLLPAQTIETNPLTLTSPNDTSNVLTFPTIQGRPYQLQTSPDLVNWTQLGSPITGTGNSATVTDAPSGGGTFYRLLTGPVRPGLFNSANLPANDDGSTNEVNIGFPVNFYGYTYTQCYVNNNGNITFDQSLSIFTPTPLQQLGHVIIAPFWADVDTRVGNTVSYGFNAAAVDGKDAFGVNWLNVGYFSYHADKLNTFQLVLINRSDTGAGNFDVEYNYQQIRWETGDASRGNNGYGGFPCRVGLSNGSNSTLELAHSGESLAFLDTNPTTGQANTATGLIYQTRNSSGIPGRLVFQVRNGVVIGSLQVSAGPTQYITGLQTTLAGSASDPAGGGVTVHWSVFDKPTNGGATFSDPNVLSPTVTFQTTGSYVLQLTATSTTNPQNSATATVHINVSSASALDSEAQKTDGAQ